ncbi:MAG: hypothetical protein JWR18_995 [Segetibacter sp.]|nr:hypothetical protein [Segetibacter sp.]
MSVNNSGTDPTITVENEKQVVTIGSTSSTTITRPTITVEKEKEIIDEIERHCSYWRKIGNIYIASIIVFGLAAVSTSVLVSIYTGSDERIIKVSTIKIMACISTISLAILTAFNLVTNSNNARNAWKSLNAALMLYAAGSISIQQLIEQYQKGENQFGSFTFTYGSTNDKPATYAQDIVASHAERLQKEAEEQTIKQKEANAISGLRPPDPEKILNGTAISET